MILISILTVIFSAVTSKKDIRRIQTRLGRRKNNKNKKKEGKTPH